MKNSEFAVRGIGGVRDYLAASLFSLADTSRAGISSVEDYIQSRVYIRTIDSELVRMNLTPVQVRHLSQKRESGSKRFLLLKARRMGFTTLEQAVSYATICTKRNVDVVTLAQDKESTSKIFRMVKMMHEYNPEGLEIGYDSKNEISYPQFHNSFFIGTAGSRSFGRGSTLFRVHGSEVAFWGTDDDQTENLVVGLTEAARNGEVILETTANGAYGWFYETYFDAVAGKNSWCPLFYPWFADAMNSQSLIPNEGELILDTLEEEEADLVTRHGVTLEQLSWRRSKRKELRRKFQQEYPSDWQEAFMVSRATFFETDTIARLSRHCKDPIRQSDNLTIWSLPKEGEDYVIGMDASGGGDAGDNSVACVLSRRGGEQVARLLGKWRPEVFARKAAELGEMYNKALLAPEENNHGHSVINTLVNTLNYKRIYYHVDETKKDATRSKKPGWQTTPKTRPIMLDELNDALEDGDMIVNDKVFLEECKVFVDSGNGKYEAAKGRHDDLVIGWAIAWQARKQKRRGAKLIL